MSSVEVEATLVVTAGHFDPHHHEELVMVRGVPMLPHSCSNSYALRWPTGVRFSHGALSKQRRGKFWKNIIAIPGEPGCPLDSDYQWAEYESGYNLGFRHDCQDAEWYKTWLVFHANGLNAANNFLLGYIHGKHLRTEGVRCRADLTSVAPATEVKPKTLRSFEELRQVIRHGVRRPPRPLVIRDMDESSL